MKTTLSPVQLELISEAAHEVNRTYAAFLGDHSHASWADTPEADRAILREGVLDVAFNEFNPVKAHEAWTARKRAEGWTYGLTKDPETKTHPCMISYDQLPFEQQYKDTLFESTVKNLLDGLWRIPQ